MFIKRTELVNLDGTNAQTTPCPYCKRFTSLSCTGANVCTQYCLAHSSELISFFTSKERDKLKKSMFDTYWSEMSGIGIKRPEHHVLEIGY